VNVTNQTADSADVALTGQVSVTVAGQTVSEDIGTSSQTARFVREGGQWRFCESIDG
jgi:hypothetical protein